ncbi:MAG: trehalose-phosphatase [Dehalococcoidia bacterium]|nr:trehalose-phosphatase [Dehalococcoidia bacterium]
MEHLFAVWPAVADRITSSEQILLMSDFDGTLSPIAGRPDKATLPRGTREAMEALLSVRRVAVVVISGRALRDIKHKVGIRGITYAGNHGIEIEGPWLKFVYPPAVSLRPAIRRLSKRLRSAMAEFEGAIVEDKGLTLSVHYRLVRGDRVKALRKACEDITSAPQAEGKIRVTEGKKVYEIRPGVIWDKEDAIVLLMNAWAPSARGRKNLAVFLGDDLTDEGGFRVVNENNGISVFVGEADRETAARYFLRSPAEVGQFLRRLFQSVRADSA